MKSPSLFFLILVVSFAVGAFAQASSSDPMEKLRHDVVYGYLVLSPTSASQAGYHKHDGRLLDEELEDYSATGIARQKDFYKTMLSRVASLRSTTKSLSK
jgi:hypothetical protein